MNECATQNPVAWFEIYVSDMSRAKRFYELMFDMQLSKLENPGQPPGMEMWAFSMLSTCYGATGALVRMPGLEPGNNSVIVYFSCVDCALVAAKAENAGGRIHANKFSIGQYGHIALVFDSENNLIGLHSMQ